MLLYLIPAMAMLIGMALPLVSRPRAGAVLVMALFCCDTLFVSVPPITLGVQIYLSDIAFGVLFVAVTLRCMTGRAKLAGARWIPVCLFLLFFVALTRGFALYGAKDAGNESRGWFYFLSGVLYFSSFNLSAQMRRWLTTAWLVVSVAIMGLAIFRWMATIAGLSIATQWEGVGGSEIRVLNAGQAYFLAMAFFASVFLNLSNTGPRWQRKAFYVLGPVLLLLQHRTVWVLMILGLLWLALQDARFRKRAVGAILGMAVVGIVLIVFLFGHQSAVAGAALRDSASNDDTFLWRVAGWYELLFDNPARNALNDAIGQPFGTGYERVIGGARIVVPPHNWYVEAFLRLGVVGLFLLVSMYSRGLRRLKCLPAKSCMCAYPDVRFWRLVLLLQLAFFFTYGALYEQSILTGVALAGMRLRTQRSKTPGTPSLPA